MLKLSSFFNINPYLTENTVSAMKTSHRERSYMYAYLYFHVDYLNFIRL